MKNEAIDQLKYITKLEHLVVQSVKSQTKFRNKIKNKLKR